ncbi:hypothetical protein KKH30_05080 [Candidatus Micrarchaeota archaeon]|nr:hypothetical protein [Candidatus Micrarchaeota archaeon]MBU1940109.1 hypothetical protein [Candidatus Micrarchaeota archaeon]
MFPLLIVAALASLSAFLVCWLLVPFIALRLKKRGIAGRDMNKLHKPEVPEMGGIAVLFGFAFAVMFALGLYGFEGTSDFNLTALLAAFSTIVLVGIIGIVDDLIGWRAGIKQWQHALMPVFAALPIMVLPQVIGFTDMTIPIIGVVSFGIYYAIFVVPVAITGASNAVNMLAGLNGLEAGMGILITGTLLLIALFLPVGHPGQIEVTIILAAMLGALIAFLRYNWAPAKVFGGDSLTLMIGASAAAVAIIGNMEKIAALLFAIYFIELLIKLKHRLKSECYGIPQEDGTLAPDPRGGSLTHWIMRRGRFTEKGVVLAILGAQAVVCVFVFLVFWFKLFKFI